MAYQSQKRSKVAQIEPDDTLATIAEHERAEGNDITAEDIARFNWGTEDPEQIQELPSTSICARRGRSRACSTTRDQFATQSQPKKFIRPMQSSSISVKDSASPEQLAS